MAYFDSELSRKVRRVAKNLALKNPTLAEVKSACDELGYKCALLESAKHPAVWWKDEGAVEIVGVPKKKALLEIAKSIRSLREKTKVEKTG